jgi:hypothetical protein
MYMKRRNEPVAHSAPPRYLRSEAIEPADPDRRAPVLLISTPLRFHPGLKQIHVDLCALVFERSYERAAAFA